jgi:peptidoglycan/LPS O-acetylase OafA/YrhL
MREPTALSRWLSKPLIRLLGRSSYSFYLLQVLTIDFIGVPWAHALGSRMWASLLTFALTWLVAVLLFACYEEPMNLAIRRRSAWIVARIDPGTPPIGGVPGQGLR